MADTRGITFANLDDPSWTPQYKAKYIDMVKRSPELMTMLYQKKSGSVDVGDTKYTVVDGVVTHMNTGSFWGPVLAAAAVFAGGAFIAPALAGAGGAGAGAAGTTAGLGGVEAGATAGVSSAVASGTVAGGMATLPALSTAAATTAISGAASTIGPVAAKAAAVKVATAGGAVTTESILKAAASDPGYTTNAAGVVTDAANVAPDGSALAGRSYSDLVRYGLPIAGQVAGSVIAANAAGKASDAQQKYLEEALAYEKESDLYKRGVDAAAVTKEAGRYSDYQNRIGPFIENGTNANDRMSSLLGLAPRTGGGTYGGGGASGGSSGPPASQRVASDPATQAAIRAELQRVNSSDDPAAWDEYLASHGDSSVKSWDYWKNRIDVGDGVGKGYRGAAAPTPSAAPPAAAPPVPGQTVQPQARSAAPVQMRAPDGSVQTVPADQVDHFTQRGATLLGAAA